MTKFSIILLFSAFLFSCKRNFEAPVPDTRWELFESASAVALHAFAFQKMEAVYSISNGAESFGNTAVAKWSYAVTGADTVYHLSLFCEREISYFILEGKKLDDAILLNGYWRKMQNTETGKARLTVSKNNGADHLLSSLPFNTTDSIIIEGIFGAGENMPDQSIRFSYSRPLYKASPLEIVAHRGGGSTADLLPASENSTEMIRLASRFGATGVEIDVRFTSDDVPVLYHDATLNERLIRKNGLVGPVENYSYAQLNTMVQLKNGEKIPTLQQALETIVYQTPLRYVWLDTKFSGPMQQLRSLQQEYQQKASSIGRTLEITIGIPDEEVLNNFLKLPGYQNIPSVCELTPEDVAKTNARIWAPRWTLGLQNGEVQKMHAQGKRVFVWTLDIPANVYQFMNEGAFDGILTNYPSIAAFYYYAKP
jgi:glycerophosphoryl diester phosphodiesterase